MLFLVEFNLAPLDASNRYNIPVYISEVSRKFQLHEYHNDGIENMFYRSFKMGWIRFGPIISGLSQTYRNISFRRDIQ